MATTTTAAIAVAGQKEEHDDDGDDDDDDADVCVRLSDVREMMRQSTSPCLCANGAAFRFWLLEFCVLIVVVRVINDRQPASPLLRLAHEG